MHIPNSVMYFVLNRLMDLEEIMWNVADLLIKPVVFLRKRMFIIIHRRIKS